MTRAPSEGVPLSCYIIACNEARRIGRTIAAVRPLADEVLVIDSGSTDDTVRLAEEAGARVIFNPWPGYGAQKRFGEEQCRNDWLLNLDADEVITPAFAAEVRALFASGAPPKPGYRMRCVFTPPFAAPSAVRWWSGGAWVIRLYDRCVLRVADHPTWDAITPPAGAPIGVLRAPVLHYTVIDMEQLVDKVNRYTTAQAAHQPLKGAGVLTVRLALGFPLNFLKAWLLQGHVTRGRYGFMVAMTHAFARFLKDAKMLERHLARRARDGESDGRGSL